MEKAQKAISHDVTRMNTRKGMNMLISQSSEAIGTDRPLMLNTMVLLKGVKTLDFTTVDLVMFLAPSTENRIEAFS